MISSHSLAFSLGVHPSLWQQGCGCCLLFDSAVDTHKTRIEKDGRGSQLNRPQAGASNLCTTRTFNYPLFLQIWPRPVWMQGSQTTVWSTLELINYTCARLNAAWELSGQKNTSVTTQDVGFQGSWETEQRALTAMFYCDIQVLDYASWCLGFFIHLSLFCCFSPFVQTWTSSARLLNFADTCDSM